MLTLLSLPQMIDEASKGKTECVMKKCEMTVDGFGSRHTRALVISNLRQSPWPHSRSTQSNTSDCKTTVPRSEMN